MNNVYHYFDNSKLKAGNMGVFGPGKLGWRDPYFDQQIEYAVRLGVGFGARQPFTTASTTPLHVGGWLENIHNPAYRAEDYIRLMDKADRLTGCPVFQYWGHGGADLPDWSHRRDVKDRPYRPDPHIDEAVRRFDTNAMVDLFNKALSPALRAGHGRSAICLDGSGAMVADHPWFRYIDTLRYIHQRGGHFFGIESAPDLDGKWSHLEPFNVAMVWHMFLNELERGWFARRPARPVVFIDNKDVDPGTPGDNIGGWTGATHQRMALRFVEVRKHNGIVAMCFNAVVRGGFDSIDQWLGRFAP